MTDPSIPADTDGGATSTPEDPPGKAKSQTRNIVEWAIVLFGALFMAVIVRTFLFQAFYIPSPSMNPTLVKDDRVVVNKLSYKVHDVNRHDVVVFSRPPGVDPTTKDLIKRVIGLPGETVSLRDGHVYINGKKQNEPYTATGSTSEPLEYSYCRVNLRSPLVVPKDEVFVMGDNRNQSLDSRCFGPIPIKTIVGRAFILVWPFGHMGTL